MAKKNPLKKLGAWIDDKVSYHLTQQEEKIKSIIESLLKEPDTLKYMPLSGIYYIQNKRLNAIVKVSNNSVHATVNGILLLLNCTLPSAAKLKDVIITYVIKDVESVESELGVLSRGVSDKIIGYIESTKTNGNTDKQD